MQELQAALTSGADALAGMQFQLEARTQRAEQLLADLSFAKAEVSRLQGQLDEASRAAKCAPVLTCQVPLRTHPLAALIWVCSLS